MGRRSTNTTKSGKFMNPTDQARKEARKRELKKNKKQRTAVRQAVLKSKVPLQILEELEFYDKQEFDPKEERRLNERVIQEKRRKLLETFERVVGLYKKEDDDYATKLAQSRVEYEAKRHKMMMYYEQVKLAERVKATDIPLPAMPDLDDVPMPAELAPAKAEAKEEDNTNTSEGAAAASLPADIPLPSTDAKATTDAVADDSVGDTPAATVDGVVSSGGGEKKTVVGGATAGATVAPFKLTAPPSSLGAMVVPQPAKGILKRTSHALPTGTLKPSAAVAAAETAKAQLAAAKLRPAGAPPEPADELSDSDSDDDSGDSDGETAADAASKTADAASVAEPAARRIRFAPDVAVQSLVAPAGMPAGVPGMPPHLPGMPAVPVRPPMPPAAAAGVGGVFGFAPAPPRLGLAPLPPPLGVGGSAFQPGYRIPVPPPPAPLGVPPPYPRGIPLPARTPHASDAPSYHAPSAGAGAPSGGSGGGAVLSAPPDLSRRESAAAQFASGIGAAAAETTISSAEFSAQAPNSGAPSSTGRATIEAKPQLRNLIGDATKLVPTAVVRGRSRQQAASASMSASVGAGGRAGAGGKRAGAETAVAAGAATAASLQQQQTTSVARKDDAYDQFMREIDGIF